GPDLRVPSRRGVPRRAGRGPHARRTRPGRHLHPRQRGRGGGRGALRMVSPMTLLADLPLSDSAPTAPPVPPARLLICEDEGLTALRLQKALTSLGYHVAGTARDGE